jgi:hypothetical protein
VPAKVEGEDTPLAPTLLGEPLVDACVSRHPVQADERLTARIAPLVHVQQHRELTLLGSQEARRRCPVA